MTSTWWVRLLVRKKPHQPRKTLETSLFAVIWLTMRLIDWSTKWYAVGYVVFWILIFIQCVHCFILISKFWKSNKFAYLVLFLLYTSRATPFSPQIIQISPHMNYFYFYPIYSNSPSPFLFLSVLSCSALLCSSLFCSALLCSALMMTSLQRSDAKLTETESIRKYALPNKDRKSTRLNSSHRR